MHPKIAQMLVAGVGVLAWAFGLVWFALVWFALVWFALVCLGA